MIIDFHTHAFPDKIAERAIQSLVEGCNGEYMPCSNGTVSGLVDNMDKFGVDISVVQPVITKPSQTVTLNNWAKEITCDRLISFGGIHHETDDYKRDIDLVCELGLPGIKLHPEYQQFYVDDPYMLKIYDYALSKGLVILFHAGYDPAYPPPIHSSPKQFAEISKQMQGGIIIAAHLGGQRQWNEVEEYLVGTEMYIDTSMGMNYYPHDQFLRIVKNHGADKILFGSDSPWSKAGEEIEMLNSFSLSQEEKELILYKNAKRILKI
ncbi:MAG: amidohydrolase family protein [Clostridia bacterium]|nr:amidohydrolase family protein [Clostridia bacterium]